MGTRKTNPWDPDNKGMNRIKSHLFIIAAPSGAGKTTLCRAVLDRFADMIYSVSYTTRKPRSGERNGIDYHFISKDDFIKRIERDTWAEWAKVHGNYYGTDAEFLGNGLATGKDILLDIDIQGTVKILEKFPDAVTIFIIPPSLDTLKIRLESRGTDSHETIARRLKNAKKEISQKGLFRHIVVNDQLPVAVAELISTIEKYRST